MVFVSAGTCTISAAIASDGTYEASTSSSISFSVVFTIGSIGPGGGKIFYYSVAGFSCGTGFTNTGSPTGGNCHYLEVAPNGPSPAWTDATYAWSGNTDTSIGTTSTAIGSGYMNTLAMISQNSAGAKAGTIAHGFNGGGLTDWYLPSKDELNEMYNQKTTGGGFVDAYYWSSSENGAGFAWYQIFTIGVQDSGLKTTAYYVRPIRAF